MALSIRLHDDTPPYSPERALCQSIMLRAFLDLRYGDPQIAHEAQHWFTSGACAWLCELLDMPLARVQAAARRWQREATP